VYVLTLTLADGTVHAARVDRMPRFWKSWLMQRMPYGTDFYGATFHREIAS
jgi:hypothetical protein